jgi:hypothetical protein
MSADPTVIYQVRLSVKEGAIRIDTADAFDAWARSAGWDNLEQFEREHRISHRDLLGRWFLTLRAMVWCPDEYCIDRWQWIEVRYTRGEWEEVQIPYAE